MSRIGVDVGTSRVKAVRFDDGWAEVDSAGESTVVLSSPDGRREQDMEQVWEAVARVVTEVVSRCPDQVELVAVTAQGDGTWLIDAEGRPVGEALLWNDNRAARLIDRWQLDGVLEEAFRTSGSLGAPGLANAQLRWLREHEPRRLESATTLLSCGSWVYHRLTGERVLERSDAANPFCDARTWEYDDGLLELFDLSDLAGLLPPVVSGSEAVAPLRADVAERLGLPAATPVALASYDVVTSAVGSGVGRAGTAMAVLGTTLCVGVAGEDPLLDRTASGMTLPSGTDGRWLVAFATLTGTEALDWAARTLGLADAGSVARLAATSTRTDLPLFLPYLSPAGSGPRSWTPTCAEACGSCAWTTRRPTSPAPCSRA